MKTYSVVVADHTGDTLMQLTAPEIQARANAGSWVFVDDVLVPANTLTEPVLEDAQEVRLMPGLIGGLDDEE
tara:strand:+ start:155 stop:370 length:216 start_codon:yes stop_codon:yes gene_type:complete